MKQKKDCCIMYINNTLRECIINMTKKINEELERFILHFPEQYLWIHDRWKIK